jgi:proliferating cell nuclear antigen
MFRAQTNEGFLFKVLAELLQQNIKSCCLNLNEEGITLQMTDNQCKVLVDIILHKDKFNIYKYKFHEKKIIGLNLSHLYKMLKSVKKKDTVELFIESEEDYNFGIKITPKDNSRTTTSFIKIQNIQNIEITLPDGYKNSVIIPSGEFHKMIKDMIQIGSQIEIESTTNTIQFKCISEGIYSRQVMFGIADEEEDNEILFRDTFYTDQLNKIIKISGLSNKLYIKTQKDLPLLFKTNIGTLGTVNLFIKNDSKN